MSTEDLQLDAVVELGNARRDLAEAVRKFWYADGPYNAVAEQVQRYDVARSIVLARSTA
jgi:hypothetical protein